MKENNGNNKKKLLYNLISSEIELINKENRKPGWTKWAILVSMSTLFWLLFGMLETTNYCTKNIALYIILFCFIYDFFILLGKLLSEQHETKNRVFYTNEDFISGRFSLLIIIIKYLILIILANNFSFDINLTCLKITFFVNLIFACIAFILSYLRIPLYLQEKKSQYLFIIYFFFYISIFFKVIIFLANNLNLISLTDLKISLTLCAIFYLIYLLSKSWSSIGIRSQLLLIDLRKDLILKENNLKEIKERLDVILDGLKAPAVFQRFAEKYLFTLEEMDQIQEETEKNASELNKLFSEKGNKISDQEKKQARDILATAKKHIDKSRKLNKNLRKILGRFYFIQTYLKPIINIEAFNEIMKLLDELLHMTQKSYEKTNSLSPKFKKIMSQLEE